MEVPVSKHKSWRWPRLWRAGTVAMIVGAGALAVWAFWAFGLLDGYTPDGSRAPIPWTANLALGVSAVALITLLLLGSSSYLIDGAAAPEMGRLG